MAIQLVNLGTYANDNTGDDLRTAFNKVNANFTELDVIVAVNGANLGTGIGTFANKSDDPGTGNLLNFRSLAVNSNLTISLTNNTITIGTQPTITANIVGNVTGNLTGDSSGTHTGNVTGNVTGNLIGDSSGTHTGLVVGNVTGNITGDSFGLHTGNVLGNVTGNLIGNSSGTHSGFVVGNVTGNVTGDVVGNVTGNAGTVTNGVYTTSSINALADVDTLSSLPVIGQALAWSGVSWVPQTIESGLSDVFDLGSFQPIYTNPLTYLLDQIGVNFGTFTSPAGFTIDGGTF